MFSSHATELTYNEPDVSEWSASTRPAATSRRRWWWIHRVRGDLTWHSTSDWRRPPWRTGFIKKTFFTNIIFCSKYFLHWFFICWYFSDMPIASRIRFPESAICRMWEITTDRSIWDCRWGDWLTDQLTDSLTGLADQLSVEYSRSIAQSTE